MVAHVRMTLTQILGKVLHDDGLNEARVLATLAEPIEAREMRVEILLSLEPGSPNSASIPRPSRYLLGMLTFLTHPAKLSRGSLRISLATRGGNTMTSP